MIKLKTFIVCCLMILPFVITAQSCAQRENEVVNAIMARRSVRKYLDKPVEHEKLALVAKCGIYAPNALNRQEWAVRVVENGDFIKGTTELFLQEHSDIAGKDPEFKNMYRNAPNIIVVAIPEDDSFGAVNAGLMGENMMLAAQSLGLGTCCLGSAAAFLNTSEACAPFVAQLNLPDNYTICYVLAIGYPDGIPESKPRDENKIEYLK